MNHLFVMHRKLKNDVYFYHYQNPIQLDVLFLLNYCSFDLYHLHFIKFKLTLSITDAAKFSEWESSFSWVLGTSNSMNYWNEFLFHGLRWRGGILWKMSASNGMQQWKVIPFLFATWVSHRIVLKSVDDL